jgi:hypothetical protein
VSLKSLSISNGIAAGTSVSRGVRATCGEMTASVAPAAAICGSASRRASSSALQYGHQRPR